MKSPPSRMANTSERVGIGRPEVLAVGDAEFQKKCLGKMGEVSKGEGRTVLFVSHNMAAVQGLCEKGILLQNGELNKYESVSEVIKSFNKALSPVGKNENLQNDISKGVCLKSIQIDEDKLEFSSVYSRILDIELEIYENFDCIFSVSDCLLFRFVLLHNLMR